MAHPPGSPTARAGGDPALVRAAAAGDGAAFAELYDRHERRAFNLAYRITGSREDAADATQEAFLKVMTRLPALGDRELEFGAYLLTAVRHTSYDVIARTRRAEPAAELPDGAAPVGGAGAAPPEDDPDRNVLLAAQQEEIRAANATLPPRQREVLALRELDELSYDEIAERMGMNRNSVAQLISRARIGLRDALRRTALAAVLSGCEHSERTLPLIALRDDRQLLDGDARLAWLRAHLAGCEICALGSAAMADAGASYRAWALVPALEALRRTTIAKAGERLGHDWSDAAAGRPAAGAGGRLRGLRRRGRGSTPGRLAAGAGPDASAAARSRRIAGRAGACAVLVLLGLLATRTGDALREPAPSAVPAAEPVPVTSRAPTPSAAPGAGRSGRPSAVAPALSTPGAASASAAPGSAATPVPGAGAVAPPRAMGGAGTAQSERSRAVPAPPATTVPTPPPARSVATTPWPPPPTRSVPAPAPPPVRQPVIADPPVREPPTTTQPTRTPPPPPRVPGRIEGPAKPPPPPRG